MSATSEQIPKHAGVVGWPITHSLSPHIHQLWAQRAGIPAYYSAFAVPPTYDAFADTLNGLAAAGFAGVNVTLPHKEHALRFAKDASAAAAKAGAANMISFGGNGPYAENSDITGFEKAVCAVATVKKDSCALVLGAGGAARGIVLALERLGVTKTIVANRTKEKAAVIADDFGLEQTDWEDRADAIQGADIIVNTTSLGMSGQPGLELSLDRLDPAAIVTDIVYTPLKTPLLIEAKARGNIVVDGLSMLMHQAVPGFQAWFGAEAVVDDDLRGHLVSILNKRSAV